MITQRSVIWPSLAAVPVDPPGCRCGDRLRLPPCLRTSTPPRGDLTMASTDAADLTHLFTAIDHVGVAVATSTRRSPSTATSSACTLVHEETNPDQGVREAMMAVGDSGSFVQLLAPLTPDSPIGKFLDRSGPGLQQVAYRVDDIDDVSADPARAWPPAALRRRRVAAQPVRGSTSSTPRTPVASCSNSCSRPHPRTRVQPCDHPTPEADVQPIQQIADAITSGDASSDDFAALEVPDHYTGAAPPPGGRDDVRRDAHAGPRPAQVAAHRGRPAARDRSRRGTGRRHGVVHQLQHRVVEHLRAGVHLRLPASIRPHLSPGQAPRPAVPRHRLGPVRRGAAHRPRRPRLEARRRGRRALSVGRAREPARPQRHDARPRAAHLGLRDQLRWSRPARPRQGEPAARQARPPHVGGSRVPRTGQQHRVPPAGQP